MNGRDQRFLYLGHSCPRSGQNCARDREQSCGEILPKRDNEFAVSDVVIYHIYVTIIGSVENETLRFNDGVLFLSLG